MTYRAPVADIAFALKHTAGLSEAIGQGLLGDLSIDLVDAILDEAARFANDRIAPLLKVGDKHGTPLKEGAVTTPPGWAATYRAWTEAGWNGLSAPEAWGGQALPLMLNMATQEMWAAGSMAFSLCPTLTVGAIEALVAHGSEALRARYLEKLVSGEWTGTMNLTEPQAGSDLGALRTRAEPAGDGSYRIFGTKIFITYGEHDMADNIVHLVLARLPDAPAGTRGISLFLVPKFLVNDDGSLGVRNDVKCVGVEHKLGIHGSPTCTMVYGDEGGAVGWLIGEENRGVACMFTMMNNARLAVGIQGVAIAEAAFQKALAYANDRRQGKAPGSKAEGMSPIAEHPDVARMLLTQKAYTAAARAICYACAHAIDMSHATAGDDARRWSERAGLLTPLAKAFSTDVGCEVASLGVQIHGGMGFIEETGAAQFYRDARIAPIYEGTNGIQAIDLVTRKLPLSAGGAVRSMTEDLVAYARAAEISGATWGRTGRALEAAFEALDRATDWIAAAQARDPAEALAVATPYLRLMSLTYGGALMAKGALAAEAEGVNDAPARVALVRFFAEHLLGEVASLADRVLHGAGVVADARIAL